MENEISKFKTVHVQFKDSKYNYLTSINGNLSDERIISYFEGTIFNMGHIEDDHQICVKCTIEK